MKKYILSFFTVIILVLFTACSNTPTNTSKSNEVKKAALTKNLTLLVTSDIHSGVEDNWTLAGVYEKRKEYEAKGDYTLLIDDGDLLQGNLLSSTTKGVALMEIANEAGFDIMTFGNHEFDYGMEQFMANAKLLKNPYISCNFNKNGELIFKPYVIKEFDGVKFAFIGINTPETLSTSKPKYFQDENGNFIYSFFQGNNGETLYTKIQETINSAKSEGADYIIAVAHIGQKETSGPYKYSDIISHTSGFDVFLDGHGHDTDQVNMKDKDGNTVFRMGVGTKLSCIGVVTFTPAGTIEHELLTYEKPADGTEPIKYNNSVSLLVNQKSSDINDAISKVIGTTDFPLYIYDPEAKDSAGKPIRIVRRMGTNLGDLIADAFKNKTGAECSFINGGGIRVNIEKGDITLSEVIDVLPFGNILCLIEVTGQQILDAMEWGCHVTPKESGGFPHVSGITFDLDTSIKDPCKVDNNGMCAGIEGERRVKNLKINGEPVNPTKKYKLSTLSYTALSNGDGYTAFDGCTILEEGAAEDYTLVVDYIKNNLGGKIPDTYKDPYGEGRINIQ
ncbi:MAG: bifunctional metallophosphatase/5'-nucleotidase [Lachnospiraceae bacterium]|nr:bifunctional metallophosphatase/5'-nucleotidase [Lachnospiraceae bacterium]